MVALCRWRWRGYCAARRRIIGASRLTQIQENTAVLSKLDFTAEELDRIESILSEK